MKPTWNDFLKVAAEPVFDLSEKKVNWLTDTLIVNPLAARFRRQNEAYKAEQAARAARAKALEAVKPKQIVKKTTPDRTDELTQIAQGVSDTSKPYSIARNKYYHNGQAVAR